MYNRGSLLRPQICLELFFLEWGQIFFLNLFIGVGIGVGVFELFFTVDMDSALLKTL